MKKLLLSITIVLLTSLTSVPIASASTPSSSDADSALITAVSLLNRGQYEDAQRQFTAIAAKYPSYDAAFYYLGVCSCLSGDVETGETYLREACRLDPHNFYYQDYLARISAISGHPEVSIEIYEDLVKDYPKKTDIYYTLANLYARQGQTDKVLETFDEIERVVGDSEMLALSRYQLLMSQQKNEEAFGVLQKYNEKYTSPDILTAMGDYKLSQYEDSLAIAYYDEALSYDSSYGAAMIGRVEAFRISRKYPQFFEALDSYVSESEVPKGAKSQYLGQVLEHADQRFFQNFRTELDSTLTHYYNTAPEDSTTISTTAIYYFNTEREAQALDFFKRNVEIYPESLSARGEYIHALGLQEQWESLVSESETAYQQFPEVSAFIKYKTIGLYNLEQYPDYIKESERLIAANPTDTATVLQTYSGIGDVYHLMGETAKAYKTYDRALKIDPTYVPILNNYAYFLSVEGRKLKKAYSMSKITIETEPDNATYLDTFGWILHLMHRDLEAKPFFKHAMLYGGKENATVLDHYAEVLYELKEYDLAKVYWNLAKGKNTDGEIPDLDERIEKRLSTIK